MEKKISIGSECLLDGRKWVIVEEIDRETGLFFVMDQDGATDEVSQNRLDLL